MDIIHYYMKEAAVHVLGPGTRYVLWTQGCQKNCPGCIAGGTHAVGDGKSISARALAWEIALSGAEGLTISGGEPFLQAPALAKLIRLVHKQRDMGVIVYTGYRYEDLPALPGGGELLEQTDLLIDGEYIQSLDDHQGLRGSSNQRVIPLTDRYQDFVNTYHTHPRQQEVFVHGTEVHETGLPGGRKYQEGDILP